MDNKNEQTKKQSFIGTSETTLFGNYIHYSMIYHMDGFNVVDQYSNRGHEGTRIRLPTGRFLYHKHGLIDHHALCSLKEGN